MSYVMICSVILVGSMIAMGLACIFIGLKGQKVKTFLGVNIASLFAILVGTAFVLLKVQPVSAAQAVGAVVDNGAGLGYIAAALSTGLAAIGAGIAVAATGSAALGAISEDPKILGKTLIYVGLAEGIAIYGLIISILILGQLG